MESVFVLLATAYFLSVGFMLIVNQKQGFKQANRFWFGSAKWLIRKSGRLIGDVGHAIARAKWIK